MAESTLSPTFTDISRRLRSFMGWDRDTGNALTTQQAADQADAIKAGLRDFYSAHNWSFLTPRATITTVAPYTTGMIAIVSGVVTLTGGTFPSTAAAGEVTITSGASSGATYSVNTRDTGTQVTLDDLSVNVTAGATYSLGQTAYDMPSDYTGLIGPITYAAGVGYYYPPIYPINEIELRQRRANLMLVERPYLIAISLKANAPTTSTSLYQIEFWPTPDAAYVLTYRCRVAPNTIDGTNIYPRGGALHGETIISAILAAADRMFFGGSRGAIQDFTARLPISVQQDAQQAAVEQLGYFGDPSDCDDDGRTFYRNSPRLVGYEGHTIYEGS